MNIKQLHLIYIILFIFSLGTLVSYQAVPAYASGYIRRLKGMADDMAGMEEQKQKEGINYQKAANFLNSADIKQDMPAKDLIKICGEPVAKADDGLRWVYKSPTSTFFKGEKIYFYLDKDQKLVSWEKVYQK